MSENHRILFDTTKIPDGKHRLKLIASFPEGKEGIKVISFEIRNGPAISVIGLRGSLVVGGQLPIAVNSYGSERKKIFVVKGSENPKGIPIWIWVAIVLLISWGLHYLYLYWTEDNYYSIF